MYKVTGDLLYDLKPWFYFYVFFVKTCKYAIVNIRDFAECSIICE